MTPRTRITLTALCLAHTLAVAPAQEEAPAVPHMFKSGDIIRADQMNANFQALLDLTRNEIVLPDGCSAGQILSFDGENWVCANGQSDDAELPALPEECEAGQTLTWSGSEWACQERVVPTYTMVWGEHYETSSTKRKDAVVDCPEGSIATGGGGNVYYGSEATGVLGDPVAITSSFPIESRISGGPGGWAVTAVEMQPYDATWTLRAHVICATY